MLTSSPHAPSPADAGAVPAPIAQLLQRAGIQVNGPAPWDMQVRDSATWRRMMAYGTLGFGESYMEGHWDCERLDELVCRMLRADADPCRDGALSAALAGAGAAPCAGQPAVGVARLPRRRAALRPGQRPLRRHAGQPHGLFLRLLAARRRPRTGAGAQARTDLPQARTARRANACWTSAAAGAASPSTRRATSAARSWAPRCPGSRRRWPANAAPGCR